MISNIESLKIDELSIVMKKVKATFTTLHHKKGYMYVRMVDIGPSS